MITLFALSLSITPQEGTLLDTYTLHIASPEPLQIEPIQQSLLSSGQWQISSLKKDESSNNIDLLLTPLASGKVPLFIEPLLQGLFVKINPYDGPSPPIPPLLSMSPVMKEPLPAREEEIWSRYLAKQPEINLRLYEEKQIPWRSILLFLGLLLILPYLFRLLYIHLLLPLSYISPEQKALTDIDKLRRKDPGRERLFALSAILRTFYTNRYAIQASHMTLDELSQQINANPDIPEKADHLAILEEIDLQKFTDPASSPPQRDLYQEAEIIVRKSTSLPKSSSDQAP